MIWWFYNLLFPLVFVFLLPKYLLRMAKRGGYAKDFLERFGIHSRNDLFDVLESVNLVAGIYSLG